MNDPSPMRPDDLCTTDDDRQRHPILRLLDALGTLLSASEDLQTKASFGEWPRHRVVYPSGVDPRHLVPEAEERLERAYRQWKHSGDQIDQMFTEAVRAAPDELRSRLEDWMIRAKTDLLDLQRCVREGTIYLFVRGISPTAVDGDMGAAIGQVRRRSHELHAILSLPKPSADSAGSTTARPTPEEYVFRPDGGVWEICYEGVGGHYSMDYDGFGYLHQLIRRPYEEISALGLMRSLGTWDDKELPRYLIPVEDLEEDERRDSQGDSILPTMDNEAIAEIKQALIERKDNIREVRLEIDEARRSGDCFKAERLEKEELGPELQKFDELVKHLSQSTGLGGKARILGGSIPTMARQLVRQAIRRAVAQLRDGTPPLRDLAKHLKESIPPARMSQFTYRPTRQLGWKTMPKNKA